MSYTYDVAGRRSTLTIAGQPALNYTYDNANRLTQIAQGTIALGLGYDAAGRRSSVTWPNGVVGSFTFDGANQLTAIAYSQGGSSIGALNYGYDAGGHRTSVTGSLASFATPDLATMSYDGSNRLTTRNGTSLTYDANGNLTGLGATTYS